MIDRYEHTFKAMGCHITIWLELDDAQSAERLLKEAAARFYTAEARLSRFRPTSELSQLNQRPEQWVPVSETLWRIVNRAIQLSNETDGLFDPAILPFLEAAGYDRSYELLAANEQPYVAVSEQKVREGYLRCDPERRALWLPAGIRLDLGGIAKGDTAEQVMRWLSNYGPCLIDAAGDLTAGAAPAGWPGWSVGISAPWHDGLEGENLLRLWLCYQSLATSGVDYRRWWQGGLAQHHIIDPRTGIPAATDLLTVSVLADDASTAEAWATAALVAGADEGLRLLLREGLAAALIDRYSRLQLTTSLRPLVQFEVAL